MPLTKTTPLIAITLTIISGCSAQLNERGERVNLVTASSVHDCVLVDSYSLKGSSANDALNLAFNKAAELGADSMAIDSATDDGEITAYAFTCSR